MMRLHIKRPDPTHGRLPARLLARLSPARRRALAETLVFSVAALVTAGSAIMAKELGQTAPPLAAINPGSSDSAKLPVTTPPTTKTTPARATSPIDVSSAKPRVEQPEQRPRFIGQTRVQQDEIRWFNGRPIRPARKVWMTVTAYSPDEQSCGEYADGYTATLHSVTTNGGNLVAADPTVLPYGSLVTVPGYDDANVVPVLDCGGAIKGKRLDVLYPTHERALEWGVQRLPVVVWEYADGLPPDNPRHLR